jgi:hypothetical protein
MQAGGCVSDDSCPPRDLLDGCLSKVSNVSFRSVRVCPNVVFATFAEAAEAADGGEGARMNAGIRHRLQTSAAKPSRSPRNSASKSE